MADTEPGTAATPAAEGGNGEVATTAGNGGQEAFARLLAMLCRGEIALSLGIVAILVVLILPMPAWLLDVC
ncbi:MAG: hypothetical protein WD270_13435, partial [Acetobacterales bacterium]